MMKKLISGLVLLAMLACLVLPAAAAEPTALPMTVAEAVDGVSAYCTAAMQAAGTYSDWSILQLARSGNLTDAMRQDYLASLAEKLRACGGVLDKSYYTQYSRTILALTACGENARDFAGYDLTAPLANYDQTVWQGVNLSLIHISQGAPAQWQSPSGPACGAGRCRRTAAVRSRYSAGRAPSGSGPESAR